MKLHLPKSLFVAVLAACAALMPTTYGADIISVNFTGNEPKNVTSSSTGTLGGVNYEGWNNIACSVGTSILKDNKGNQQAATLVLGYMSGDSGKASLGKWHSDQNSNGTVTGDVQRGYIDVWNMGENHYTIDIANDWLYYDVIFYMAGDSNAANKSFAPMEVNGNEYIGGTNVLATDSNKAWSSGQAVGCTQFTDANTITITDLSGALTATNVWNGSDSRATLAGMQIIVKDIYHATLNAGTTEVNSAEWVCNGVSTAYENIPTGQKYLSVSANSEGSTLKLTGGETLNALEVESNKVTISADSAVTITNLNIYEGAAIQFDTTATVNSLRGVVDVTISENVDLNITGNHLTKSLRLTAADAIKGSGQLVLKDGFTLKLDHGGQNSAVKSNIKVEAGGTLECLKSDSAAGWGGSQQGPKLITLLGSEGNLATMKVKAKQTIGQGISMQGHSQIVHLSDSETGSLELFQPASGIGLSASNMGNVIYTDVQIGANTNDYSVGIKVEDGGELTIYGNVYSNSDHGKGKLTKSGNGKLILAGTSTFNKVFTNAAGITEFTGNTDFKSDISISNGEVILKGALTGTTDISATGAGSLKFGAITSNANISASTAAVAFAGTLTMANGKTLTFEGENQSVSIDPADMSAFSFIGDRFTDINDLITTDGNGFVTGQYILINGGTIAGEAVVSYDNQNYTINNENRGFGAVTDYSIYYLKNNSASVSTVSSLATQNSATVQEYHLAAGTTLNVDAVPAAIKVNGAATLNISEGITLNHSSVAIAQGASATLTGSGTYTISQGTLNAGTDATSSPAGILIGDTEEAKWTGQVNLLATGDNNNLTVTWLDLNHYGNADSTIKLKGVSGYLCLATGSDAANFESNLIMENSWKAALELTDGCSADNFTFSGDITNGANGGNFIKDSRVQQNFTFAGNISGWTGEIKLLRGIENNGKISTITFSEKATEINNNITAADSSRQHNNKDVEVKATVRFDNSDSAVTMNGSITDSTTRDASELNLEVNTAKGTTFNGAVTVSKIKIEKGSSATFTKSVSTGMLEVLGNVSFTATEALSVSKLEMGAGAGVSVSKGETVGTLTVTQSATFNGGNVQANLTLANNATVTINSAVALGSGTQQQNQVLLSGDSTVTGYTLSLEKGLTLQGNILKQFDASAPGSGEVILFRGVDTLNLGGVEYNALSAASGVKLSDYFRNDRDINFEDYYIGFKANGDVYAGLIVPEPTTATLSLLALAGLCARRRRASR